MTKEAFLLYMPVAFATSGRVSPVTRYKSDVQTFATSPGTLFNGRQDLSSLPWNPMAAAPHPERLIVFNIATLIAEKKGEVTKEGAKV